MTENPSPPTTPVAPPVFDPPPVTETSVSLSPVTDIAAQPVTELSPEAYVPMSGPSAGSAVFAPAGSAALSAPPAFGGAELLAPAGRPSTVEVVTCPECGLIATVDLARRSATDFCRNCDFPLFWAKSTVILASEAATGASLRRLPGAAGQAGRPSVPCPTCGELNLSSAVVCIRCGGPMVLPEMAVPEPEPEPEPLLEPEPEPEPEHNWWPVILVIVSLLAILVLVLLALYA